MSTSNNKHRWEAFIAYPGPHLDQAKRLHQLLSVRHKVFLDVVNLLSDDDYRISLPQAQLASRVTIVLLHSEHLGRPYFRDEIERAVELERNPRVHHQMIRVDLIPLTAADGSSLAYGLAGRTGLPAYAMGLDAVADRLSRFLLADGEAGLSAELEVMLVEALNTEMRKDTRPLLSRRGLESVLAGALLNPTPPRVESVIRSLFNSEKIRNTSNGFELTPKSHQILGRKS